MLRDLKGTQRLPRVLALRVDGTGTASILEGSTDATLTDNGTGDYTLTFAKAFARVPVCVVTPVTAGLIPNVTPLAASVQVTLKAADGTTATDGDFHVLVHGWDAADAN